MLRFLAVLVLTLTSAGAVVTSTPVVAQASSDCNRAENIEDDDWPLENDWFHAKLGTGEMLPNADPFGEEEWTFHGSDGFWYADMHYTWASGRAMQTHGPCGVS